MSGQYRYLLLPLAVIICGVSHTVLAQEAKPRPVARLVSAGPINTAPKRISPPVTPATSPTLAEASAIERRAFDQTNEVRIKNGLPALTWDADVCRMARIHSENMSRRQVTSLTSRRTVSDCAIAPRGRHSCSFVYSLRTSPIIRATKIRERLRWRDGCRLRSTARTFCPRSFAQWRLVRSLRADGSVFLTQTFITR